MEKSYFCIRACIGGDGVHYNYQTYAEVRTETFDSAKHLLESWSRQDELKEEVNFTKNNPNVDLEWDDSYNFQKHFIFVCENSKANNKKIQKALMHCVHFWSLDCCNYIADETYKKQDLDRFEYFVTVVNGETSYCSDRDSDIFDFIDDTNPLSSVQELEKYLFDKVVETVFTDPLEYEETSKIDSLEQMLKNLKASSKVIDAVQSYVHIRETAAYRKGYKNGKDIGYEWGEMDGKKAGLKDGRRQGYRKGYDDGFYWSSED